MTITKASAFGACLIGAIAVGIWIGPYVTGHAKNVQASATKPVETVASAPVAETTVAPVTVAPHRPAAKPVVKRVAKPRPGAVMGFSPELHTRLKPLLNQGADFAVASDGFRDAEQFATLAHASRNTEVPFMVLKHRVLSEGMTLPAAILASKPDVNAAAEANRAKAEAKIDMAAPSQVAANRN